MPARGSIAGDRGAGRVFDELARRVLNAPSIELFDAVEAGVPTHLVGVIVKAFGQTTASVMSMVGVSATSFRRNVEASRPLPAVAGCRVVGLLRIAATLRRSAGESDDAETLPAFDLYVWLASWMQQASPELGGRTPAMVLRSLEGQRAMEQLLERMRGGLPA